MTATCRPRRRSSGTSRASSRVLPAPLGPETATTGVTRVVEQPRRHLRARRQLALVGADGEQRVGQRRPAHLGGVAPQRRHLAVGVEAGPEQPRPPRLAAGRLGQAEPDGAAERRGGPRHGEQHAAGAKTSKATRQAEGLPGSPRIGRPSEPGEEEGLPRLHGHAVDQHARRRAARSAAGTRSRSPTETPPMVMTASPSAERLAETAAVTSSSRSGTARRTTSAPSSPQSSGHRQAVRVGRPPRDHLVAGGDDRDPRPARTTSTSLDPDRREQRQLPAPRAARPAGSASPPAATSSPARRTFSPGRAAPRKRTRSPAISTDSSRTTASAPSGSGAPVKMRAAWPAGSGGRRAAGEDGGVRTSSSTGPRHLGAADREPVHRRAGGRRGGHAARSPRAAR